MPYAMFFTEGWAVHGTTSVAALGRPASHGCVRLLPANAKTLFRLVSTYGRASTRIVVSS
jgi:lipoprotein-anchoring transpeptidase ErfK/SrfK